MVPEHHQYSNYVLLPQFLSIYSPEFQEVNIVVEEVRRGRVQLHTEKICTRCVLKNNIKQFGPVSWALIAFSTTVYFVQHNTKI